MPALLDLDPAVFSSHTTQVGDVRLHYVRGGQGPTLLLWHGFLATWYGWRKIMPALAERYTVVAPDMRGYGDSDKPAAGYDARTLAADFRGLLEQLNLHQDVTLVAHDMGAPPALLYAAQHPTEVRALAYLEEPVLTAEHLQQVHQFTPEGTHQGGLWWWNLALADDMPERLIVGRERAFLTWFYEHYTHDGGASVGAAVVTEYLRTFRGAEGVRGALGVYREVFATAEQTTAYTGNRRITVSVLALGGEKSLGDKVGAMLGSVARQVQTVVVPDCGHFIPDEQPSALVQHVDAFLAPPAAAKPVAS